MLPSKVNNAVKTLIQESGVWQRSIAADLLVLIWSHSTIVLDSSPEPLKKGPCRLSCLPSYLSPYIRSFLHVSLSSELWPCVMILCLWCFGISPVWTLYCLAFLLIKITKLSFGVLLCATLRSSGLKLQVRGSVMSHEPCTSQLDLNNTSIFPSFALLNYVIVFIVLKKLVLYWKKINADVKSLWSV